MEKELTMPKLRPEMENGVLKKQLFEEGDTVNVETPVAILETK